MFEKINKRRRKLLWKLIKRTKVNRDLCLYVANRWRWLLFDKTRSCAIPFPTNGMIELGNVCNLHCNICPREYEYGKQMDIGFMPLDKAKALLDEMIPYLDSIGLTGLGETMMYPHLLEILQYIKSRKPAIVTTVSTNAHFPGYLQKVTPLLPYLDCIQFSVDGCDEVYERMRPGTNFKEITENIRQTISLSKETEFMINFVVTQDNYTEMPKLIDYALNMNVSFVNFNIMSIRSMPNRTFRYYDFMKSPDFRDVLTLSVGKAKQHPEMEITGLAQLDCSGESSDFRSCTTMWEHPYITWNGYYVPCCGKPFPKVLHFGNVFDDGLMSVLNSEKAQNFRRLWQKNTPPSFCHNCIGF